MQAAPAEARPPKYQRPTRSGFLALFVMFRDAGFKIGEDARVGEDDDPRAVNPRQVFVQLMMSRRSIPSSLHLPNGRRDKRSRIDPVMARDVLSTPYFTRGSEMSQHGVQIPDLTFIFSPTF